MERSAKGTFVETARGYSIFEWSGPGVDDGSVKPFSSCPSGSFDWTRHDTLEEARAHVASAPSLRKVRVEFEAYLPNVEATEEQVDEWVRFELHESGSINHNPLMEHGLEATDVLSVEVIEVK